MIFTIFLEKPNPCLKDKFYLINSNKLKFVNLDKISIIDRRHTQILLIRVL